MAATFRRATRQAVKIKIGIQGPSGSGKTEGALQLATQLAPTGQIAVIDTENKSASLYADRFTFDTLELGPPFTVTRYLEAIHAAIRAGYEVLVMDTISHEWAGSGGILEQVDAAQARGGNKMAAWITPSEEHKRFIETIVQAPIHIIATMRAKQDYAITDGEGKKKGQVQKLGFAPIQREGAEYEFSIVFELQMDHRASVSKDRTGLFEGQILDFRHAPAGRAILDWLATAKPAPEPAPALAPTPPPAPAPAASAAAAPTAAPTASGTASASSASAPSAAKPAREKRFPLSGPFKDRPIGEMPLNMIQGYCDWIRKKQTEKGDPAFFAELLVALTEVEREKIEERDRDQFKLDLAAEDAAEAADLAAHLAGPQTPPSESSSGKSDGGASEPSSAMVGRSGTTAEGDERAAHLDGAPAWARSAAKARITELLRNPACASMAPTMTAQIAAPDVTMAQLEMCEQLLAETIEAAAKKAQLPKGKKGQEKGPHAIGQLPIDDLGGSESRPPDAVASGH